MGEHTNEFFANSRRIKEIVEADRDIVDRVLTARRFFYEKDGQLLGEDIRYGSLNTQPSLGVKIRNDLTAMVELAVMADLYNPQFVMPSYALIVATKGEGKAGAVYLVEDLGRTVEIPFKIGGKRLELSVVIEERPELGEYIKHLSKKGYELDSLDGRRTFVGIPCETPKIAMVDFDCINMSNCNQIVRGATEGKGKFKYLAEIFQRLNSPELRLNIE